MDRSLLRADPISIVSHHDADGLCAAAILSSLMKYLGKKYSLSIVPQLLDEPIKDFTVFADLCPRKITDHMLILDHHLDLPKKPNVIVNTATSASGLCFLESKDIMPSIIKLSHIAFVGILGDLLDKNGLNETNKAILADAVSQGLIEIKEGIRLHGNRPLYKQLAYSPDLEIPGVTGNPKAAIKFVDELNLDRNSNFKQLSHNNKLKLKSAIIDKRENLDDPDEIYETKYFLTDKEIDAREFSTLLNACGRLGYVDLAIEACLGTIPKKVFDVQREYKEALMRAIKLAERILEEHDKYIIINFKDRILSTLTGTLASIFANNNRTKYVLVMSRMSEYTKVSLRAVDGSNVNEIMREIAGPESGGHETAAGALIDLTKEKELIEKFRKVIAQGFLSD